MKQYADETKITLNFIDKYPTGLKKYLIKRYKTKIDKLLKRLSNHFGEKVDIYYTFEDMKDAFAMDLDFYLVNNKANYPIAHSGSKRLPVCFVITPPGYKKKGVGRMMADEVIYKISKSPKGIVILYRDQNVKFISWERLLDKAMVVDLNKTGIFKGKSL